MRFGLTLINSGAAATADSLVAATQASERAGLDSVWVYDHLLTPVEVRSAYPYAPDGVYHESPDTPFFDPLALFGILAARTDRIRIGAEVFVAPYRHPIVLAKTLATIEQFAPGRLVCGLGAGWMEEEFAAVGVSFERRGPRLAEYVKALRTIWSGEPTGFDGEFYSWPASGFLPAPTVPITILMGGHADVALRRAARIADGFAAIAGPGETGSEAEFRTRLERVHGYLEEAGRDPAGYEILLCEIPVEITPEPDPDRLLAGPPELLAERIAGMAALGVTEVMLLLPNRMARVDEEAAQFMTEVAALLA
jgi:probable F420-dependent oxidoreductase